MDSLSFKQISERLKQISIPENDLVIGIRSGGISPANFVVFHLNADLEVITLNYRDENNNPRFEKPMILYKPLWNLEGKRNLLVDDVSVSGKKMNAALEQLKVYDLKTSAMKGSADFDLFYEIRDCFKCPCEE